MIASGTFLCPMQKAKSFGLRFAPANATIRLDYTIERTGLGVF